MVLIVCLIGLILEGLSHEYYCAAALINVGVEDWSRVLRKTGGAPWNNLGLKLIIEVYANPITSDLIIIIVVSATQCPIWSHLKSYKKGVKKLKLGDFYFRFFYCRQNSRPCKLVALS